MPNPNNLTKGGTVFNCTGCCTSCGRHFTSNKAFDKHREGTFEVTLGNKILKESTRHCVDPESITELESYPGKCQRAKEDQVLLWRMANEGDADPSG